jgi:hypothetical protein
VKLRRRNFTNAYLTAGVEGEASAPKLHQRLLHHERGG